MSCDSQIPESVKGILKAVGVRGVESENLHDMIEALKKRGTWETFQKYTEPLMPSMMKKNEPNTILLGQQILTEKNIFKSRIRKDIASRINVSDKNVLDALKQYKTLYALSRNEHKKNKVSKAIRNEVTDRFFDDGEDLSLLFKELDSSFSARSFQYQQDNPVYHALQIFLDPKNGRKYDVKKVFSALITAMKNTDAWYHLSPQICQDNALYSFARVSIQKNNDEAFQLSKHTINNFFYVFAKENITKNPEDFNKYILSCKHGMSEWNRLHVRDYANKVLKKSSDLSNSHHNAKELLRATE